MQLPKHLQNHGFRHQIMQCYNFMCGSVLSHNPEVGPGHITFLANIEGVKKIQSGLIGIPLFSEVFVPVWVTFQGTAYRAGMTVFMSYDKDGEPKFGLIKTIFILGQTTYTPTIKLVVQKWETKGFERHFFAYSVIPTQVLAAVDVRELQDHHPLHAVKSYREHDDNFYISLRYRHF